jgi:hypothetical protein
MLFQIAFKSNIQAPPGQAEKCVWDVIVVMVMAAIAALETGRRALYLDFLDAACGEGGSGRPG